MKRIFASFNVWTCNSSMFVNHVFDVSDQSYESEAFIYELEQQMTDIMLSDWEKKNGTYIVRLLFFKIL